MVTLGSFSLLMLACFIQSYVALKRGRDGQAGAWLVIGSIKPQLVLLPGLMLLAGRRWRVIAIGALVGGALALIASLALGPAVWRDYLAMLGRYTAEFDRLSVKPQLMWNLRGTLTLVLGGAGADDQFARLGRSAGGGRADALAVARSVAERTRRASTCGWRSRSS